MKHRVRGPAPNAGPAPAQENEMAYCTLADVQTRIGKADLLRLADQDGDGVADAAVVGKCIDDACSHIDSYVGMKYVVPVVPTPDVLVKRAAVLTVYFLQLYRDSVTESMQKAYDDITKWLQGVAAGKITLGVTTPAPASSPGAGGVRHTEQPRVFGRDEPL